MRFLFLWLTAAVAISGVAIAAPPESGMQLRVTGPDRQWVSVAVAYFSDNGALIPGSPKTKRLQLTDGRATMPLEKGRAGYAVNVLSPTQRKMVVQLRNDDKTIDQKESSGAGRVTVRSGRIKSVDKVVAPDISLSNAHRRSVGMMLTAFIAGETKTVVSDATIANIDWPSLDAYSLVTRQIMGAIEADETFDGWATWKGKRNSRIYAGPLRFDGGETNVILAVIDNRLVDFIIRADRLPDQWFIGPAALKAYAQRGEELMRLMFGGDVRKAHSLFSFRVQNEITVEKLQGVHRTLVGRFGDQIEEIELRSNEVDPVKDKNNRNLTLVFDVLTKKGIVCEGKVEVLLDRAIGTIPRGHLTSFNVREKGPSISAERKQAIAKMLRSSLAGKSEPLIEQLHPIANTLTDPDQVDAEVQRWKAEFGKVTSDIVWTDWVDTPGGRGVEGPVVVSRAIVTARVDFADDYLLGVTLTGNTYAGSTLDRIKSQPKVADHGRKFWTHLFSNQKDQAYQLLPPVFQKQLSREQFEAMGAKLATVAGIGIEKVSSQSVRLDARPDRVEPVMLAAYHLIEFKNRTYQGARSEYHVGKDGSYAMYNFNTEFADQRPLRFDPYATFATAITSDDPRNVIQLFHPIDRAEIDPLVLSALMKEVRATFGGMKDEDVKGVAQRRYEHGTQRTYVAADLRLQNEIVPAQWSYLYGWLKSFDLESSKLTLFARRIEDTAGYRERGSKLFSLWLSNKIPQAVDALMPELRNEKTAAQLSMLRETTVEKLGNFRSVKFDSESFDEDANRLRQQFKLTFDKGTATGRLVIVFDAMHSHIARADVVADDAERTK